MTQVKTIMAITQITAQRKSGLALFFTLDVDSLF